VTCLEGIVEHVLEVDDVAPATLVQAGAADPVVGCQARERASAAALFRATLSNNERTAFRPRESQQE
jgi:hypothetical protein